MEATLNNSDILVKLFIISAVAIFPPDPPIVSIIAEVFRRFTFFNESGLLQFWACSAPSNAEDIGCRLTLTDQPFISSQDHRALEDHRRRCLEVQKSYPDVGLQTRVGNWLAGRAAQTQIADYRTRHYVLSQDPRNAEAAGKGQLVLPVFHGQGAGKKLVGIIELVTIVPKESYSKDFEQLCQLLQDFGLQSKYLGKMIKVEYKNDWIKFPLPYSATLTHLHRKVTKRFEDLRHKTFCIVYKDTDGILCPVSSDEHLQHRMDQSVLSGETLIRMHVR